MILDQIRDYTRKRGWELERVSVEGHADWRNIEKKFRSNWDLSGARASAVVSFLETSGIAVDGISFARLIQEGQVGVVGYNSYRPKDRNADNLAEEAMSKNRRIEIKAIYKERDAPPAAGDLE